LGNRIKIDAAELIGVQPSDDGTRLHLKLLDQAGETVSVSLPAGCLNAVITAIPHGHDRHVRVRAPYAGKADPLNRQTLRDAEVQGGLTKWAGSVIEPR
jgi:hypothetical protein